MRLLLPLLILAGCGRPDLILHGAAGAGIGVVAGPRYGCAAAAAAGLAKEAADDHADAADALVTALTGCAVAYLMGRL